MCICWWMNCVYSFHDFRPCHGRPLIAEVWFLSQASPSWICGRQSGYGRGCLPSDRDSPAGVIPPVPHTHQFILHRCISFSSCYSQIKSTCLKQLQICSPLNFSFHFHTSAAQCEFVILVTSLGDTKLVANLGELYTPFLRTTAFLTAGPEILIR